MLRGKLMMYVLPPLVLAIGGLAFVAYTQTKRVWTLELEVSQLEQDIEDYKRGAALAEQLRAANEELKDELVLLQKELQDVEGIDTPLPDGLIDFFDRMRKTATCKESSSGCPE